ncbi:hypothetical protein [Nonlabens agnitus]|uniref:Lipocalin-like domain-containing protein n=1 Tax=Nonlabens agnitus TaxID=870484 RepID=A0A2S9WSS2_9FLAO|nr:hypothetical protein [Nonlabens agnitus]PRP66513.1 hypothetical protein BST86_05085 [Nonlabens agnitus]
MAFTEFLSMKNNIASTLFFMVLMLATMSCKNDKDSSADDVVEVLDCSSVKTGKFKYANPAYGEWIIDRNETTSVEISKTDDLKIYSDVVWITDCEYELHITDTDNLDNMAVVSSVLRVVITDVMDYGYKCISYTPDGPEEFEMIRIDG